MDLPDQIDFRPLNPDPTCSDTLPGYFYHAPDVFASERERVFFNSWQFVAHASELQQPGSYVCARIVDQHIFVIRGLDGQLRAFYNVCQHRAHELLAGKGQVRSVIQCPYHAWTYGTDGALREARLWRGLEEERKSEFQLAKVRVDELAGLVFVNLQPDASALAEQFGGLAEDLAANIPWLKELRVSSKSSPMGWTWSELAANWKVLAENCLECYHCAPAHPAFVDLIDMRGYRVDLRGGWIRSSGELKKSANQAYHVAPDEPSQRAIFWYLWPNTGLGVVPGEASMSVYRFFPLSAETTAMTSIILTRAGEEIKPERLHYRWHLLWLEDEAICQSVHKGLKSRGYRQGKFVVDPERGDISEHGVHHFQMLYAAAMGV